MKKKLILVFTAAMLVVILLASCASEPAMPAAAEPAETLEVEEEEELVADEPEPDEIVEATERPEGTFMEIRYATGFTVEYIDDLTIVTDAEDQQFLLVPRGQTVPDGFEDTTVIFTPVERVLFGSTTHVGMMRPFDIWGQVGGIVSTPGSSEAMDLDVEESGYDITYVGSWMTPDFELIQEINPDIAFVYTGTSPQTELITMLEELDIPFAVNNEYMESTHEGRMEWMLFFAPFFGIDEEVVTFVEDQLEMLVEMEALIEDIVDRPRVAWGSYHNGVVWVPGVDSYTANMVRAAGGEYLFSHIPDAGSAQISVEDFYATLVEADFWIYFSNRNFLPDYDALLALAPIVEDVPVVENRQVWQLHESYFYFTDQLAQQVIDLAVIFHPGLFPDREPFHYNPLAE